MEAGTFSRTLVMNGSEYVALGYAVKRVLGDVEIGRLVPPCDEIIEQLMVLQYRLLKLGEDDAID